MVLGAFALGAGAGLLCAPHLTPPQRLAILIALALGCLAIALAMWRRLYETKMLARRMASDVQTIAVVNAAHRLNAQDLPPGFDTLANAIDALASRYERLLTTQQLAIQHARQEFADEHARLVALLHNLAEGVLICTPDGRILLYNQHAESLLGDRVALGRSLFDMLDRLTLAPLLENLRQSEQPTTRSLVLRTATGRFVRLRIAPALDTEHHVRGFVLALEDITRQVETSSRRDQLVQTLSETVRHRVAAIRAAIETLREFPAMDASLRHELEHVIADEASRLSAQLEETLRTYADVLRARWRLDDIPLNDILEALADRLNVERPKTVPPDVWIRAETPALIQALAALRPHLGTPLHLTADSNEEHVRLVLHFPTPPPETGTLRHLFQTSTPTTPALADIIAYHGGEIWAQRSQEGLDVVILLPRVDVPVSTATPTSVAPRPEYYDFDLLFHTTPPPHDLETAPLRTLAYTVFDTETTGLDPLGDEIVALGAIRIVNMHLLANETFDELARPRRPIPPSATRVHGIRTEDVAHAPNIEEVVQRFHMFVGNDVLVAHNAAFDMRFLRTVETATGVRFDHIVLDTLLLSAIVHPEHGDHSLEAIAARLGVPLTGRHTALGDALTTARIFLKLIPLLEAQGLTTLGDVRIAAEQTYLARIRY